MGKIVLLDDLTINKIAAGEVIERPASVVKELVENSIDAGATKITVEVKNGGISKIRIIDNGTGIAKDDLEFAFERHATSKIRVADDLETVKSMGFRGEALASIVAISNVEIVSKTETDAIGTKVTAEGGKILEKVEVAAQTGTTITVNNLFFNTPVRYKFLKKDFTELGYIEDIVTRVAIANPNIAIKLLNENKTIIQTTGDGDIKNVVYCIYGKEIVDGLIQTEYEYEGIKVSGVIGKPEIARNNRTYQLFFVNRRFIKDKTLSAGAEQAFKGLIPIGKYGFLILNIEIEPKNVDVNVHPTKLEVRWSEEQKIFKAVYHAIREALLNGDIVKNVDSRGESKAQEFVQTNIEGKRQEELEKEAVKEKEKEEVKSEKTLMFVNLFKKKENVVADEPNIISEKNTIEDLYNKKNFVQEEKETYKLPTEEQLDSAMQRISELDKIPEKIMANGVEENFDEMYIKTFGKMPPKEEEKKLQTSDIQLKEVENISIFKNEQGKVNIPEYKYIGVLFSTYIIIELNEEAYIIDQHAAHERVMYEKIKKNFYSNAEKDSQIMLLPDIINVSHKEKSIVRENLDLFKKSGFILEEFGENTVRLIGVPAICEEMETKELFLEILDAIGTVAITAIQEKEEKFISTIACKAAVKANMKLTKEEIDNLMKELLVLPNPFTCPHGRPTAIKMSKYEIERKFNRK